MTLERPVSGELKLHASGFGPTAVTHLDPPAVGRSRFLLAPGGEDYVGENGYDSEESNLYTSPLRSCS
jgi:hypothetical protein